VRILICIILTAVLLPVGAALADDVIELKGGEKVKGRLVGESPAEVTVRTNGSRLVLPKAMIEVMKIEEVHVTLADGRKLKGQIEKETDQSITLRMRLGGLTIDKMDVASIERKVIERKPVIGKGPKTGGTDDQIPGAQKIKWPRRTRRLSKREVKYLRSWASWHLHHKHYDEAVTRYKKILGSNPRDTMALYDIACAYAAKGELDKAVLHLRMAVATGYADFDRIDANPDFDAIRSHKGYVEISKKRDAIQLQAAQKRLEELKKKFGEGYTYEIDEKHKLIFATNRSLKMLARMKEHLLQFADAQYRAIWDYKPSRYITIICPDDETYKKVVSNPSVAGQYHPSDRSLVASNIHRTLDHEFTHALHYADQEARRINAPNYIKEGFAELFESGGMVGVRFVPRRVTDAFHSVKRSVEKGEHVPWRRLCLMSHEQFMQRECSANYGQSRYMFVYLYERGKLKRWYDNYCRTFHRDKSGRVAWEMTFCKTFDEIEKDWVAWMKTLPQTRPKLEHWGGAHLGVEFEECDEGVALYRVEFDSPAFRDGLRAGDIVTGANETKLESYKEIVAFLNSRKPGDKVAFKVLRGGKEMIVNVTLGKPPEGGRE
jgi:tetratricopeptide (TPR) repeat protein